MDPRIAEWVDKVHEGDCLDLMRQLPDGCVDLCLADPPYGCHKNGAVWDVEFPREWWPEAQRVSLTQGVVTGSCGLRDVVSLGSDTFLDVIAGWNANGLTRGPLGFGNWLACTVFGEKPRQGQNFTRFCVSGDMQDHPTPKPIEFVRWLVLRLTDHGGLVLDPFLGSGTTAVACVQTGRHFIGMELDPGYCEIARKRIAEAQAQPRLDFEKVDPPRQEVMF